MLLVRATNTIRLGTAAILTRFSGATSLAILTLLFAIGTNDNLGLLFLGESHKCHERVSVHDFKTLPIGNVTGVCLWTAVLSVIAANGIDVRAAAVFSVSSATAGVPVGAKRAAVGASNFPHLLKVLVESEGVRRGSSSQQTQHTEQYNKRHHLVFLT